MLVRFNVPLILLQEYINRYPDLLPFLTSNEKAIQVRVDTDTKEKLFEDVLLEFIRQIKVDKDIDF